MLQITVCLANALAARAECCRCDCQQSGLQKPHLYYLPIAPPSHTSSPSHGLLQSLGHLSAQDDAHYSQSAYNVGYHSTGSADHQYSVSQRQGIENSLEAGSKVSSVIYYIIYWSTFGRVALFKNVWYIETCSGVSLAVFCNIKRF